MVVMPGPTDVANPAVVVAVVTLLIVATDRLDELQATWVVISRFVPSEKVPVAVNCWVMPTGVPGIVGFAGLTDMDVRVRWTTTTVAVAKIPLKLAVMMVLPAAMPVTIPILLTEAMEVLEELQATCSVMSEVVPFENVPVAVSCKVKATGRFELAGVIDKEDRVPEVTVRDVFPDVLP